VTDAARLPTLHRSRFVRWGAAVVLVLLGGSGFLPQFGGPGYEAALAGGIVLPAAAAIAAALELSRERPEPWPALARGLAIGSLLALLGLVLTFVHGARVGFCDPSEGLWLFLLGPACGATLGGAWGALAGHVAARFRRRRLAAVLLALAGPLAGILLSLWRFYSSPMVFAFDPFFGYFSGPLYDTVIDVLWTLATYRIGSAFSLLAAVVLALHLEHDDDRLGLRLRRPEQLGLPLLGAAALAASLLHIAWGPELGHYSTTRSIEQVLEHRRSGKRCDVFASSAILERDLELFTRDCDAHVPVIERYFGARGPAKIRVFLFASDLEKGRLMGASRTYIAKPWREEVYVQAAPFPHPVIGHELAHVIAGSFGSGMFRVAGPLGGWIPDPGRIEGIAVAAAPDEDDELTADEWAAAMLELAILPELEQIFRLGFLGQNSSRAYTVAGAFVGFFEARYGRDKLRAWYGGADLPSLTGGRDLRALDRDFRAHLQGIELPEQALATAKARFDRPAFFARDCPRIVDRLAGQAEQRLAVGDVDNAEERYRQVLRLDARHSGARFGLAGCARKRGDDAAAEKQYLELARAPELSKIEQAGALEAAGDLRFSAGLADEAKGFYGQAAERLFDEGRLRTLDVKRWVLGSPLKGAVDALLIGEPELGPSWDVAAPLLGNVDVRHPEQGLSAYLLGRNLLQRGRYHEAATYLDDALKRPLELPRVLAEARRNRLVVACARREQQRGAEVLAALVGDPALTRSQRQGLIRFGERCGIKIPGSTPLAPGGAGPAQTPAAPAR
jgi:tetratricopeptide (TPR) repeat protein